MPNVQSSQQDVVNAAVTRARTDEAFRRQLLADPQRALGAMLGGDGALADADLEAVAGGSYFDFSAAVEAIENAVQSLFSPAKS